MRCFPLLLPPPLLCCAVGRDEQRVLFFLVACYSCALPSLCSQPSLFVWVFSWGLPLLVFLSLFSANGFNLVSFGLVLQSLLCSQPSPFPGLRPGAVASLPSSLYPGGGPIALGTSAVPTAVGPNLGPARLVSALPLGAVWT